MDIIITGIVLVALGLINSVILLNETSLLMLTLGRAHRLVNSKAKGAKKLEQLFEIRHRLRASQVLLTALVTGSIGLASAYIAFKEFPLLSLGERYLIAAGFFLIAAIIYVFLFQTFARALAVSNPEFIALRTAGFALGVTKLLGPIMSFISLPAKLLIDAAGGDRKVTIWAVTPEWLDEDSEDEESEDDESIIEAVSDFKNKIAREVMTPRTDMVALSDTGTLADAVEIISKKGVSRIPIYHETIDDIRGILYSKDLLKVVANQGSVSSTADTKKLENLARPAFFVPETKPVRDLMVEMRKHTHMVIVADEYGGTSGLVTLEDLLEEIVGDILDEFDYESPMITQIGEDNYLLDGRLSVDELNDLFDTVFDMDADSLGGLFTELIGHIPETGESIVVEGIKLVVTRVDGNRVLELRACPATEEEISAANAKGKDGDDD